ncbi:MAG: hypothetical protein K5925_02265 [Bacilli bacterium]|nr:hypothetical protein [Bacilli bacterium]
MVRPVKIIHIALLALISACGNSINNNVKYYLEDYYAKPASFKEISDKYKATIIPNLPSYVEDTYGGAKSTYLGNYNDYDIFNYGGSGFNNENYSINQFSFDHFVICMKKDNNGHIKYEEKRTNEDYAFLHNLFVQKVISINQVESIFYAYYKKQNASEETINTINAILSTPMFSSCYREENIIKDIDVVKYEIANFSEHPISIKNKSNEEIYIATDSIYLGNYGGYNTYYLLSENEDVCPITNNNFNVYFRNRFYFMNAHRFYFIKDNVFYTMDYAKTLYSVNKVLGDNHIEIIADMVFSYYYDQAENKDEFKMEYIDRWNENYRNPKYISVVG